VQHLGLQLPYLLRNYGSDNTVPQSDEKSNGEVKFAIDLYLIFIITKC